MKKIYAVIILIIALFVISIAPRAFSAEKVLFDFEEDGRWGVPEWCWDKPDYVCKSVTTSSDFAKSGQKSLKLSVDLPGNIWKAAAAECEDCVFDWSDYGKVSCDFYAPKNASYSLKAKIILTVVDGENWTWTETVRSIDLVPGKWVTLTADLMPGSRDWMQFMSSDSESFNPRVGGAYIVDVNDDFRKNIKKIAVRVETDKSSYRGDIYADNIRVE